MRVKRGESSCRQMSSCHCSDIPSFEYFHEVRFASGRENGAIRNAFGPSHGSDRRGVRVTDNKSSFS